MTQIIIYHQFLSFLLSADKATGPLVPESEDDATEFTPTDATEFNPEDDDSTSTGVSHSINFF